MIQERFWFDLQMFAGEKTEKATPRRREEARKKGQVFKSIDLNSAVILIVAFATLNAMFPSMIQTMQAFTAKYLANGSLYDLTPTTMHEMFIDCVIMLVKATLPLIGATALAALLINLIQVGFLFTGESMSPDLQRIDPIQGFTRIFSKRALAEMVKSLLKVGLTGYIVYKVGMSYLYIFPRFMDMEIIVIVKILMAVIFEMAMKVGVALLIIGIADYLFQWWQYEEGLKMSKEEVKQEYKQMEGDPKIKAKIKQRQRELAMKRMMAEVPKADVVITNPTHFAVALRYEAEQMEAPMVVAKGQDFVALRIKEIARAHDVTIVENPELARGLFYVTEIGDVIPDDMFKAVAEVLAFVYRQKRKVL